MSFRMDQFHDMVRMNTPKMNPMMTNNCCHGNDVPVGLEIANAFLSVGGQVAMMALQAKTAEQNQNASKSNAAINTAMGEGQQVLQNVMMNSSKTVGYQQEIEKIDARLDNAKTVSDKENKKTAFESNYSSPDLENTINEIKDLRSKNDKLTEQLNQWNSLNDQIDTLKKATKNAPTFKSAFKELTGGNFEKQVQDNKERYVTAGKDGKTELTAAFDQDIKQAREADEEYKKFQQDKEKLDATEDKLKILRDELNKSFKTQDNKITMGYESSPITIDTGVDSINSPADLSKRIEENKKEIAKLEATEITGKDKEKITVGGYKSKLDGLDAELTEATKDKADETNLQTKKTNLENRLKESEGNLKELKKSYDSLNKMLKALEACDVNYDNIKTTELDNAKEQLKNLRKDNSFFTKMFKSDYKGLKTRTKDEISDEKKGVSAQKENAKATAEANAKAFNEDYGTPPTRALKNQIIAQMNLIENTIKQAGLEGLAVEEIGFKFPTEN